MNIKTKATDDGWEVVQSKPKSSHRDTSGAPVSKPNELTKKQRESKRKKEKMKEKKELLRTQAQVQCRFARSLNV